MNSDRHAVIERACDECGKKFFARVERVNVGKGRFCSLVCCNIWQKRTDAEATHGIERGKRYWDKVHEMWITQWREDDGIHHTTYANWWWRMNKGEIPPKHCVLFKDGNRLNIDPSNFILVSKRDTRANGSDKRIGKPIPSLAGANSKWWTGGNSQEYPSEFSHSLRNRIKEEAKYICFSCNTEFPKEKLDVHHIDRDKTHNWDKNLVTLCKSCHRAVHGKEKKTNDIIRHLQSLLPV